MRSRTLLRIVVIGIALITVTTAGAAAARRVDRTADDLSAARQAIHDAAAALESGRLRDAEAALLEAEDRLLAANNRLYGSIDVSMANVVPIASTNLEAARSTVGLAFELVAAGRAALTSAAPFEGRDGRFELRMVDGSVDVGAVAEARRQLDLLLTQLPAHISPPPEGVIGRIADARSDIAEEIERRRAQIAPLADAAALVEELTGGNGDRRILVAIANTAEMRGTGGMILNYGVIEARGGSARIGRFGRIDELQIQATLPPDEADVPDDYLERWSGFEPTRLWRNANVAADFSIVAPIMQQMYQRATGEPIHGVIQIDPVGLAGMLAALGPVTSPELGRVTAANVVDLVLHDAYVRFPDIAERSSVMADVARLTFDKLLSGEHRSLRALAQELRKAASGGHIKFYSESASIQAVAARFGATGALPETDVEFLHLGLQNVSANKLDYFVDSTLIVEGSRLPDQVGTFDVELRVTNRAEPSKVEPRYIYGPFDEAQEPGLYRAIVTLFVPQSSGIIRWDGDAATAPIVQTEGGHTLVTFRIAVPAGTSSVTTLALQSPPRPPGRYRMHLIPSPRVRPTDFDLMVVTGSGSIRRTGPLELVEVLE